MPKIPILVQVPEVGKTLKSPIEIKAPWPEIISQDLNLAPTTVEEEIAPPQVEVEVNIMFAARFLGKV